LLFTRKQLNLLKGGCDQLPNAGFPLFAFGMAVFAGEQLRDEINQEIARNAKSAQDRRK
jgi:hypothetical protein